MTHQNLPIKFLGGSAEKENELIAQMAREVREVVESLTDENNGVRRRAQHAKMLAGIKNAEFRISPGIPDDLRVAFLKPGAVYPAIVRFSNAGGFIMPDDSEQDLRGVAIKIHPPEGAEHDFLMTNAEEHHAKDAFEAMSTSVAFSRGSALRQMLDADNEAIQRIDGVIELARRVGPIHAARIVLTLKRQMKIPVESLATETYWSRSPLRIGEVVVKYLLSPVIQKVEPDESEKNLGEELKRRLERSEVRFNFQVQRYVNEDFTPLEDAREAWKSRPETIAELVIPQQTLVYDQEFFESLEFNPWHLNTDAFEPLGSMNRARKRVYPAGVNARKEIRRDHASTAR
jgi:Catalase